MYDPFIPFHIRASGHQQNPRAFLRSDPASYSSFIELRSARGSGIEALLRCLARLSYLYSTRFFIHSRLGHVLSLAITIWSLSFIATACSSKIDCSSQYSTNPLVVDGHFCLGNSHHELCHPSFYSQFVRFPSLSRLPCESPHIPMFSRKFPE